MAFAITPMKFSHIDRVAEIEQIVYPSPWSKLAFINEILDNSFASYYVALENEEVLGYAGIWTILDEAHLTTLAVCPKAQGGGVGRALLEHIIAEAKAKGVSRMTLEVRVSNVKAQKLYKKYGFIACGIRPNYYADEDAVIMWLDKLASCPGRQAAGGQT